MSKKEKVLDKKSKKAIDDIAMNVSMNKSRKLNFQNKIPDFNFNIAKKITYYLFVLTSNFASQPGGRGTFSLMFLNQSSLYSLNLKLVFFSKYVECPED